MPKNDLVTVVIPTESRNADGGDKELSTRRSAPVRKFRDDNRTNASDNGVDERWNKIMLALEKLSASDVTEAVSKVYTARADYDGNSKYARCKQCSGQHRADDEFIHDKCRRCRDGQ